VRRVGLVVAVAGLVAWGIFGAPRSPSLATPTFAQAYGVSCDTCHTAVPALNAYGRYIQRTAFSSLDPTVMKRAFPLWIAENTAYDTQDAASPHQVKAGNLALHGSGVLGTDLTFHVHQWLVHGDQPGGTDSLWVAYNGLNKHNGHLLIGKIEAPGPSAFMEWAEIAPFATPGLTVGQHMWQNNMNRWGAKYAYVKGALNVEAAYLGSDADLRGATDFIPMNGKSVQWRAAYAPSDKPLEIGIYGNVGTVPLMEGGVDRFTSISAYTQIDPGAHGRPGLLAIYQRGRDASPGGGAVAANSVAYTVDVFEPVFRDRVLIGFRREMTYDGMGNVSHSGNVDVTVRLSQFLRFYGETSLAQNTRPGYRWYFWWTSPIFKTH
jgi:hypothetical protein